MKIKVTEEIWKEGNMYVSYCPELDMASCGESVEESKKNLKEVISINFAECRKMGVLNQLLQDAGFTEDQDNVLLARKELVSFPPLKSVSDVSDQAYDVSGPGQDFRSCRLPVCPNSGRSSCLFISRRDATRRDSQISGSPGLYHQKQYEGHRDDKRSILSVSGKYLNPPPAKR